MNQSLMMCDLANSLFLPLCFSIYTFKETKNIDKLTILFIHVGIVIYCFGRYFKQPFFIEIYHYLLGITSIFIPLFILNRELLTWHILLMFFTIWSRKIFNGCIVRNCESENPITDNGFTRLFNWDLIFPVLGLISTLKLYYYN